MKTTEITPEIAAEIGPEKMAMLAEMEADLAPIPDLLEKWKYADHTGPYLVNFMSGLRMAVASFSFHLDFVVKKAKADIEKRAKAAPTPES